MRRVCVFAKHGNLQSDNVDLAVTLYAGPVYQ